MLLKSVCLDADFVGSSKVPGGPARGVTWLATVPASGALRGRVVPECRVGECRCPQPACTQVSHSRETIIIRTELYMSLRPVDDTLPRETRRVRVGVYASVCK
jgi:hypothetical protein